MLVLIVLGLDPYLLLVFLGLWISEWLVIVHLLLNGFELDEILFQTFLLQNRFWRGLILGEKDVVIVTTDQAWPEFGIIFFLLDNLCCFLMLDLGDKLVLLLWSCVIPWILYHLHVRITVKLGHLVISEWVVEPILTLVSGLYVLMIHWHLVHLKQLIGVCLGVVQWLL
jgi:hypothetical protein